MSLARPRVRPRALAASVLTALSLGALVALSLGALLACDGNGNGGLAGGGATTPQQVLVRVLSGGALRGVSMDMHFGADVSVTEVTSIGPLTGADCASNPEGGRLRVACAVSTDVTPPFDGWLVTFAVPQGSDALDSITDLTCTGSDALGGTGAVACDVFP